MLDVFQSFEQAAAEFRAIILIGPGLLAVIVGLFVWLGGLGKRRLLAGVIGAVTGAVCGFFLVGRNVLSTIVLTSLATVLAIVFEKVFITILLALLAGALGFLVLARPYIDSAQAANQTDIPAQGAVMSIRESFETIKAYTASFGKTVADACSEAPAYVWLLVAVLFGASIIGGVFFSRLIGALCCAMLGTALIYNGMIMLLLYKGSAPLSRIWSRAPFYGTAFAAMTAFGTIVQLLLCQRTAKKESDKQSPDAKQAKR